ncbi:hypothetical protein V5N11_020016 [Cardamine amara subsp. amara]|uniref:Peptidase C19 ubiquitin carboxyl-terminal hydrolase domain-containing protein n=1 Tax=Cardamine amara subsp. amara TaxID=228776 RepID=A0ABD0ZJT7_CARAN
MDMEPSNDQEVEEIDETYPDDADSETEDEADESISNIKATIGSAIAMIIKSLWKLGAFLSDLLQDYVREVPESDSEDETDPQNFFYDYLLNDLNLPHSLEGNVTRDLFAKIVEHIPRWNSHFEVYSVAKKICNRCKMNLEYPFAHSYGLNIVADSLRVLKAAFMDFTFETILKVIRIHSKMLCNKEGCGKQNYVDSVILKLPSVFTIALEWENNETGEEIFETASILETEIDITAMYKYEGDSTFTKYRLASMVCLCGDRYNCVAYERNRWVRYLSSETQVIGDWDDVLSMFRNLNIRPEILFYENAMQRDHMFIAQGSEESEEEE